MAYRNGGGGGGGRGQPRGGQGNRGGPRRNDGPPRGRPNGAQGSLHEVQVDNRRQRTKIRDDMVEYFQKEGIEEGDAILEEKMAPGTQGRGETQLMTNAYGLKMDKVPLYQYHIELSAWKSAGARKAIFLTKRSADDTVAVDRKTKCRDAFLFLQQVARDIFNPSFNYYYDLQSSFYATGRLPGTTEITRTLHKQDLERTRHLNNYAQLDIIIKHCETERQLTADDLSMAKLRDLDQYDRSHQHFLEIASSQYALFHPDETVCLATGKIYLVTPQRSMDPRVVDVCNNFGPDKIIRFGVKKSAKYVEGPKGRGHENAALFIDPMKTCFYRGQTVADFYHSKKVNPENPRDVYNLKWMLQGLHVYNPHLSGKRTFEVTGFSRDSPASKYFDTPNGKTNIVGYFREKYNYQIKYPRSPLVMGKGKTDLLPLECAMIDENQPVPKNKMSQQDDARMIRVAAQPPANQVREIQAYPKAIGIDKENFNLTNNAVEIIAPLKVKGRILQNPEIVYANNKSVIPGDNGVWNIPKQFLRSGVTTKWALIRYGDEHVDMRAYQQKFVAMAKANGIEIPDIPILVGRVDEAKPMESYFQKAVEMGIDYMGFVTDERIKNQGELKMLERRYQIVTQNCTAKVANDAGGRGTATMENIVSKANPKMGGTNYTIRHNQPFIEEAFGMAPLIIGVALSHAGSVDAVQKARGGASEAVALSSVGYSANTGKDPYEFIGDCFPANAYRSEILDLIPGIINSAMVRFKENRGRHPSTMILYLNGKSEGEFGLLKRFEVPLVRKKMMEIMGAEIPLTIIIPQKHHVARLFNARINEADKAPAQNITPGVVVDSQLTHPVINEFFLNSHTAIQGTARTPKYTVIFNNNGKAGMDAIQHYTYYLCYLHQIVSSPTSLPSPVYIAMDYAERGTKVYKVLPTQDPLQILQEYSYDTSEALRNRRVNA